MEDHFERSVDEEDLCKNGTKVAECRTKGVQVCHDVVQEKSVQVCHDVLEQLETEPNLLKRVVTGDESRIFEYDPLTKRQSVEWKSALSPRPKKARVFKSKTKVMLIAFFDVLGIVYVEFLPQGETINQHVYKNILRRLMHSKEENCGKRGHGCFIMTTLQLIMPW